MHAVRSALRSLLDHHRRSGRVNGRTVSELAGCYKTLATAIQRSEQFWLRQLPRGKVYRALNALASRIHKLQLHVADITRKRAEQDPYYKGVRVLHDTIRALDKDTAKNLTLERLERWVEHLPLFDYEDPQQIRRLATVYLLQMVPYQEWEIRYRSSAPGRSLVLVTSSTTFPDPDLLDYCNRTVGWHDEYYVAATRPRWRVVWKFSIHDM